MGLLGPLSLERHGWKGFCGPEENSAYQEEKNGRLLHMLRPLPRTFPSTLFWPFFIFLQISSYGPFPLLQLSPPHPHHLQEGFRGLSAPTAGACLSQHHPTPATPCWSFLVDFKLMRSGIMIILLTTISLVSRYSLSIVLINCFDKWILKNGRNGKESLHLSGMWFSEA